MFHLFQQNQDFALEPALGVEWGAVFLEVFILLKHVKQRREVQDARVTRAHGTATPNIKVIPNGAVG